MKCDECGGINEVIKATTWWTAWGRNCFDFNWSKNEGEMKLCADCENENWGVCEECCALIERDFIGGSYISDDPDKDYLCPECAENADNSNEGA